MTETDQRGSKKEDEGRERSIEREAKRQKDLKQMTAQRSGGTINGGWNMQLRVGRHSMANIKSTTFLNCIMTASRLTKNGHRGYA